MPLSVTDMVAAIEAAFTYEWNVAKPGIPLPDVGKEDRALLFTAIARGILNHLLSQQDTVAKDITLSDSVITSHKYTVNKLTFNITIDK